MDLTARLFFVALISGLLLILTPPQAYAQESLRFGDATYDASSATPAAGEAENDGLGAAEGQSKTFFERLISWLGSFHPAVVHIPIGLFLAALIGEVLLLTTGQPVYAAIVRYCLWIGALGAFLAAPLGWFNAGFQLTDTKEFVTLHRWIGTTVALWSVLLLFTLGATKDGNSRTLLRVALLIGVGLVSFNGLLGGLIVHGADAHAF
ncbi:hypothetical protein MNBD_ALPHA05-465 [hydrothermal vent metagenome]|uniref:DUF2231 domain-containing protein n=2 Tax=hydrothermal vent metagenome TaxID=652676 RepID=A0A3B0SZT0_9ZZZZ